MGGTSGEWAGYAGKWREIRVCGVHEQKNKSISDSYSENRPLLVLFRLKKSGGSGGKAWKH